MRAVEPELQRHWDWRAAGNFLGGGAGTGLFFVTALAAWNDPSRLVVGLVGLALVAGGLACVGLELGRPFRGLNVFRRARTSWMSREAIAASVLLPVGLAAVACGRPAVALVAAAAGLAMLYSQGRMLRAARGIPAWREPMIVPLVVLTGLAEGGGLFAVLSRTRPEWLVPLLLVLVAARLATWIVYRKRLAAPGAAPRLTVEALDSIHARFAVGGHALPLLLLLLAEAAPSEASLVLVPLAGALAAGAGWDLKLALVTRAAFDQGFAIPRAPARAPGYSRPGVRPGWT